MTQPPMDENDLAKLLDKHLTSRERDSAVAHLSESDVDAELLADAAYMLRALEAEDGTVMNDAGAPPAGEGDDEDTGEDGTVVPLRPPSTTRARPRRVPARWVALAAVLAGVLLVPLALSRSRDSAGPGDFAALLANQNAGLPAGWRSRRPWPVTRGSGDPQTRTDAGRSARLGVLWVDLEVAAAAGQAAQVDTLCMEIKNLLSDILATAPAASRCDEIVQNAGSPAAQKTLLKEGRQGVADYVPDQAHFALGAWAEAAKLAHARQDAAFFSTQNSRRALDGFAESRDLAPVAREAAGQVRARLQKDGAPASPALKDDLDALVRAAHQSDDPQPLP